MKASTEDFRFENGSLYKYDKEQHAYIHCFKRSDCNTERKAINAYNRELLVESRNEFA